MPNKTPSNVFCGVYTLPSSANIRNKTKIYLSTVTCIINHSVNKCVVCIQALSSHEIYVFARKQDIWNVSRKLTLKCLFLGKFVLTLETCDCTSVPQVGTLFRCTLFAAKTPLHTILRMSAVASVHQVLSTTPTKEMTTVPCDNQSSGALDLNVINPNCF